MANPNQDSLNSQKQQKKVESQRDQDLDGQKSMKEERKADRIGQDAQQSQKPSSSSRT